MSWARKLLDDHLSPSDSCLQSTALGHQRETPRILVSIIIGTVAASIMITVIVANSLIVDEWTAGRRLKEGSSAVGR